MSELELENKALRLLLEWAEECGFGYDSFPDEYARYSDDLDRLHLGYMDGMIYIAKQEVQRGSQ